MDVIDFVKQGLIFRDIPIKATAALPEAIMTSDIGLLVEHVRKKRRGILLDEGDRSTRDGLLDRGQNLADRVFHFIRINQKVYVFWHEHVRPHMKVVLSFRARYCIGKPTAGSFFG